MSFFLGYVGWCFLLLDLQEKEYSCGCGRVHLRIRQYYNVILNQSMNREPMLKTMTTTHRRQENRWPEEQSCSADDEEEERRKRCFSPWWSISSSSPPFSCQEKKECLASFGFLLLLMSSNDIVSFLLLHPGIVFNHPNQSNINYIEFFPVNLPSFIHSLTFVEKKEKKDGESFNQ